jgi:hypothetical protein
VKLHERQRISLKSYIKGLLTEPCLKGKENNVPLIFSEINERQNGYKANDVNIPIQHHCLYNKTSSSNFNKNNSNNKHLTTLEFIANVRKNIDFFVVYAMVFPRALFPPYLLVVI